MSRTIEHFANIGRIVCALNEHEPGDWGDGSINHSIVNIIDEFRPCGELIAALANMDADTAAGIVGQLEGMGAP